MHEEPNYDYDKLNANENLVCYVLKSLKSVVNDLFIFPTEVVPPEDHGSWRLLLDEKRSPKGSDDSGVFPVLAVGAGGAVLAGRGGFPGDARGSKEDRRDKSGLLLST